MGRDTLGKFAKVASLDKTVKISNQKAEFFNKIMASTDFKVAARGTGMDVCRCFFNSIWPTMARVLGDNEVLLEEQSTTLKRYADLDEKYKLLVIEEEKKDKKVAAILKQLVQEYGPETAQVKVEEMGFTLSLRELDAIELELS